MAGLSWKKVDRSDERSCNLEVSTSGLLTFNGLEERLEVASTESVVVVALDDFQEDSGAVLAGLGEDLEEVALVVVIDEDVELLNDGDVFLDLGGGGLELFPEVGVI